MCVCAIDVINTIHTEEFQSLWIILRYRNDDHRVVLKVNELLPQNRVNLIQVCACVR